MQAVLRNSTADMSRINRPFWTTAKRPRVSWIASSCLGSQSLGTMIRMTVAAPCSSWTNSLSVSLELMTTSKNERTLCSRPEKHARVTSWANHRNFSPWREPRTRPLGQTAPCSIHARINSTSSLVSPANLSRFGRGGISMPSTRPLT
jgi:hypothetical protein